MLVDWSRVVNVFLDMDGTLLDLHFDNYFWLEHVPKRYAEQQNISLEQSSKYLKTLYHDIQGTLNWYCLDYWTNALDMDIALLKEEVDHLIAVHPHVIDFLDEIRRHGKRVVMVTNAHEKSLSLKMEKKQLGGHFDRLITSHELGVPKEDVEFWSKLQSIEPFELSNTLLVDDSRSVLESAKRYGLEHIVAISKPDSKQAVSAIDGFTCVETFDGLIAELKAL